MCVLSPGSDPTSRRGKNGPNMKQEATRRIAARLSDRERRAVHLYGHDWTRITAECQGRDNYRKQHLSDPHIRSGGITMRDAKGPLGAGPHGIAPRASGLPVVIFRPGIVIGPGSSPLHWGVGMWSHDAVCQLWGRGRTPLLLVLVDDVARALVAALTRAGH